jgi:GDP-L-fucose synthase
MILLTGSTGLVGKNINGDDILRTSTIDTDLRDYNQVCNLFENNPSINGVIHLAANVGGLFKNLNKPVEMFEDNILINTNILKAAHKYNVNKVVCCLSTCIFPDNLPVKIENIHEGPPHYSNETYAYSKRMMELHCRAYRKEYGREYYCVIPTNVYGPGDNFSIEDGHVIPALIKKCYDAKKNNTDFVIAGDGTAMRQFIFSEDLAKLILKFYISPSDDSVVLCTQEPEVSISEVASLIAKFFDFTGNIVYDMEKPNGQIRKFAECGIDLNDIKLRFK